MRNSATGQVVKIYYHAITMLTLIDMTVTQTRMIDVLNLLVHTEDGI